MINRFFHFAIVVALASGFVQAQTKAPDTDSRNSALARTAAEMGTGKWWVSLSDEARDRFIERYTKAMDHVMSALVTECAEEVKSLPRTGIDDSTRLFPCHAHSPDPIKRRLPSQSRS